MEIVSGVLSIPDQTLALLSAENIVSTARFYLYNML